jgi:hypothetical protein
MSRDGDLEWAKERAWREVSWFGEGSERGNLGVVGEREGGEEGGEGVRDEEEKSWLVSVSGGATSAEPEAANCASTTNPRRPANGDGNVACAASVIDGAY